MRDLELDREGEIPVHRQIASWLRDAILSGELPAGRRVPSKRALGQEYGVAGVTVDKAMQVLKDEGLIRPSKGLGLFVVPSADRPKGS